MFFACLVILSRHSNLDYEGGRVATADALSEFAKPARVLEKPAVKSPFSSFVFFTFGAFVITCFSDLRGFMVRWRAVLSGRFIPRIEAGSL